MKRAIAHSVDLATSLMPPIYFGEKQMPTQFVLTNLYSRNLWPVGGLTELHWHMDF